MIYLEDLNNILKKNILFNNKTTGLLLPLIEKKDFKHLLYK